MRRDTHERVSAVLARAREKGPTPQVIDWLEVAANKLSGDHWRRGTEALGYARNAYERLRSGLEPDEVEALLCPLAGDLIELARAEQQRASAEQRLERTLALYEATGCGR